MNLFLKKKYFLVKKNMLVWCCGHLESRRALHNMCQFGSILCRLVHRAALHTERQSRVLGAGERTRTYVVAHRTRVHVQGVRQAHHHDQSAKLGHVCGGVDDLTKRSQKSLCCKEYSCVVKSTLVL